MKKESIAYGRRGDKYIFISDLKENEFQRNCNCICDYCKCPLEAVKGKERSYFRHQSSYNHCHFETNEQILELAWYILEELGVVEGLEIMQDDIRFFTILPNITDRIKKESITDSKTCMKICNVNKENKTFSIYIKDKEYKIKLVFKDKNKHINKYILVIDLAKTKNIQDIFTTKEKVLEKISEQITDMVLEEYNKSLLKVQPVQPDILNKPIDEEIKEESKTITLEEMLDIPMKKPTEIVKYYQKKCPVCGASICAMKANYGDVIVCSNYPSCGITAVHLMKGKYK